MESVANLKFPDPTSVAQDAKVSDLVQLVKLVLGCAVLCDDKAGDFIL